MTTKKSIPLSLETLESITRITYYMTESDVRIDEVLIRFLEVAGRITGAEFGSFHLLDTENNTLNTVAAFGLNNLERVFTNRSLSDDAQLGIIRRAAKKKEPVILGDDQRDREAMSISGNPIHSGLAAPVFIDNKVVGVLNLESTHENTFDQESVKVIELLASLLGTTLKINELDIELKKLAEVKTIQTSKDTAFVLMPFREPFNKYYQTIIRPAVESANLSSLRADEIFSPTSISQDIWDRINRAKVIIAELTTRNPNVMYELGLSHAVGKPVIMMSQSVDDIPFDLKHLRCITYDTTDPNWASTLQNSITDYIKAVLAGKGDNSPYIQKR